MFVFVHSGGVTLTISGYGFKAGLSVTIGGKPCSINDTQPNQIKCIVPSMVSLCYIFRFWYLSFHSVGRSVRFVVFFERSFLWSFVHINNINSTVCESFVSTSCHILQLWEVILFQTSPGAYSVIVTQGAVTRTYDSFTYVASETPLITSISPQSFGVFGMILKFYQSCLCWCTTIIFWK
jgi:hypothetical protein